MKKKRVAIGIIFLIIGACIIPTTAHTAEKTQPTSRGNWLYVGGSGPGNYSSIQDAVDNASDGDTVYVYHGLYNQNQYSSTCVKIFKSINLIGEDKNTTIINGVRKWDVIRVLTDDVHISGFTVQNCGTGTYPGAGIHIYNPSGIGQINNITVQDMILLNNSIAMTMYYCFNTTFYNNLFMGNGGGCRVTYSINCSIHHNFFIKNSIGITALDESSIDIYYNEFRNNIYSGVDLSNCIGMTIRENKFISNTIQASFAKYGSLLWAPHLINYKQQWESNYWSNWHQTNPKPILGKITIYLHFWFHFPLLSMEFDRTPAQEPYVI
jgi:nitrous oxidase accessory protein NosD